MNIYDKHLISNTGTRIWINIIGKRQTENKYIFVRACFNYYLYPMFALKPKITLAPRASNH